MALPFPETADIKTSSDDYAKRFAGPTGQWMLGVQEQIVLKFLKDTASASILDVGGGHGQLAIPLCRHNFRVTVLSSSESCRKRIAEIVDSGKCTFRVGNVIELPFPNKSFDIVISLRMLTHCRQWQKLIKELCRVARYSVIIDYPTNQSLNKIASIFFRAKKRIEGDTRMWQLFRHQEIHSKFKQHGFIPIHNVPEFFLPIVFHRMLKCLRLSLFLDTACRAARLK